jgi:hypothetical protein
VLAWAVCSATAWTNEAVAAHPDHSEVSLNDREAREYAATLMGVLERLGGGA